MVGGAVPPVAATHMPLEHFKPEQQTARVRDIESLRSVRELVTLLT